MVQKALYWNSVKNKAVQCQLCPRFCIIKQNETGNCKVRENVNGTLYSLVYGKACSSYIDPIEKKPLYHFLPSSNAYSISTAGCNLHCKHCQNWTISQASPENVSSLDLSPKTVVENALSGNCKSIAYTYTEPTVFYEYVLDTAKIAKKKGIKNVIVSNGFINKKPLIELCKYIDAANIDLKSISEKFYVDICEARLQPVLETLKILKEKKVWLEIANLIIPTLNDKESDIKKLIAWIKNNLGVDTPLHFSAFYPTYKLLHISPTKPEVLIKARKLALKAGLNFVYTGNILDNEGSTTFCPSCRKPIIMRKGFYVIENKLNKGKCPHCNEKIPGVWK